MERRILLNVILIVMICLLPGCSSDKEDNETLDSIDQTFWDGTLSTIDSKTDIIVVFSHKESGYYVIDDNSYGFAYYRDRNIVQISGYNGDLLDGEWFIDELNQKNLTMKKQPFIEAQTNILTLKRIYT